MIGYKFTTAEAGVQPYRSKVSIPINEVWFCDTPFTVKSNGLSASWYKNVKSSTDPNWSAGNKTFTGIFPLIKFWYSYNLPPFFSDTNLVGWGVDFTGKFYAEKAGSYKFYFGGEGAFNFTFNGARRLSDVRLTINSPNYSSANVTGLTATTWYDIAIRYWNPVTLGALNGFCGLWRHSASSTSMPHPIVLSAGVTNITNSFQSSYKITKVISTEWNKQQKQGAIFEFRVPLVTASEPVGFKKVKSGSDEYYQDITNSNIKLRKFRMIEYKEGYKNSSGVDQLVNKFVGHIINFQVDLDKEGNDILIVQCSDPTSFTRAPNIDAPNPIDYIASGYLTAIQGHVNGETKPPALDGWSLNKSFQLLLIDSFIDPTLFIKKKTLLNYNGQQVSGGYLIEELNRINYLALWLNRNIKYGSPITVLPESADDKYLYPLNTGEYYQDIINKLTDEYGLVWGFNNDGYIYLKSINIPTQFYDDRNFTYSGTWNNSLESSSPFPLQALQGTYKTSTQNGASASATLTGSRFDLVVGIGPNCGSSNPLAYGIKAKILKGSVVVSSASYNLRNTSNRLYYDGVDPNLGYNPCILYIGSGLKYDSYIVKINKLDTTTTILDSVLVYDSDIRTPVERFKTGDANNIPGEVLKLDVEESTESIRNQAIVIGSLQGSKIGSGTDKDMPINPNNPIYSYIHSNTMDLNSIYSNTSSNFVGRPLQTLVFEPSINTQEQADFLSFNIVKQYREFGAQPQFETLGNPLIEDYDCISIKDEFKSTISDTQNLYITGISAIFDNNGYTSKFAVSNIQPISSFIRRPEVDPSNFGNKYILNPRLINSGSILTLTKNLSVGGTTLYIDNTASVIKPAGYIYLTKWITAGDPYYAVDPIVLPSEPYPESHITYAMAREIIAYSSVSGSSLTGLTRGCQNTKAQTWSSGSPIIAYYDPYMSEYRGIFPIVYFDLIKDGKVEIKAIGNDDSGSEIHIDTINYFGSDNINQDLWEDIGAAKNISRLWGCIERTDRWNKNNIDWENPNIGKGFYVAEKILEPSDTTFYWYIDSKKGPTKYKQARWCFHRSRRDYEEIKFRIRYMDNDTLTERYSTVVSTRLIYRRGDPQVASINIEHSSSIAYFRMTSSTPTGILTPTTTFKPTLWKTQSMTFFTSTANNSQGLKLRLYIDNKDNFSGNDRNNFRGYSVQVKAIGTIFMGYKYNTRVTPFSPSGVLIYIYDAKEFHWNVVNMELGEFLDNHSNGYYFYFKPTISQLDDDEKSSLAIDDTNGMIPVDFLAKAKQELDNNFLATNKEAILWWRFSFQVLMRDKSGRRIVHDSSYRTLLGAISENLTWPYSVGYILGSWGGLGPYHFWPILYTNKDHKDEYIIGGAPFSNSSELRESIGATLYYDTDERSDHETWVANNFSGLTEYVGYLHTASAGTKLYTPTGRNIDVTEHFYANSPNARLDFVASIHKYN